MAKKRPKLPPRRFMDLAGGILWNENPGRLDTPTRSRIDDSILARQSNLRISYPGMSQPYSRMIAIAEHIYELVGSNGRKGRARITIPMESHICDVPKRKFQL